MRWVLKALAVLCQLLGTLALAQPVGLANPGFEASEVGTLSDGWTKMPQSSPGYEIGASDQGPAEGDRCLALRYTGPEPATGRTWAAFEQGIDAAPLAGQRIRLRGMVRTEATEPWGGGALWLRINRADGSVAFIENMRDRLVRDSEWTLCTIPADVPADAARIAVGGLLVGGGDAWIDDFALEALGESPRAAPPAPLSDPALDRVTAFARIVGVVRHFHPAAAGADIDWDAFTASSLPVVEGATDPEALAARLTELFEPIAPGAQIFPTGAAPAPIETAPPGAALRRWRYHGYGRTGLSESPVYGRDLETIDAAQARPDDLLWAADLPGGVSCRLPLALPEIPGFAPESKGAEVAETGDDRSTRLADVIAAWNIMQHFHPYLADASCDWPEALRTALAQAAVDADAGAFASTLRRMTACLVDGHVFITLDGEDRSGALPLAWQWLDNDLIVTGVGDPLSGIKPGDRVLSVDGRGAQELLQSFMPQISGSAQWARKQAPWFLASGRPGTPAELQLETSGAEPRKVVLRRRPGRGAPEPRPERITELEPGIWYVDLTRITNEEFDARLDQLTGAKGIVFDLRGYPRLADPVGFFGHLTQAPVTSARWQVPVITAPDQRGQTYWETGQWEIDPLEPYLPARKVFLTDARAISYAESCMEIVKHFALATIVGGPTAGANGNVIPITLAGGYGLTFTGMFVEHLDGSRFHGLGILPDLPIEPTRDGVAAGRDEVLEAGLGVLRE